MKTFKVVQGFDTAGLERGERRQFLGTVKHAQKLNPEFTVVDSQVLSPVDEMSSIGSNKPFQVIRVTTLSTTEDKLPIYFMFSGHLVIDTTGPEDVILKDLLNK